MPSYPPNFHEFIRLFNAREFFEAHEVLEAEWHKELRKNDFYKGLIQAAAALVHVQKRELPGALELLRKSRGYLGPYRPRRDGLDLETLSAELDEIRQVLTKEGEIQWESVHYPVLKLEKEKA